MFDLVQIQALAGPLKDIQSFVSKPFLRCLSCVLRGVVLLEGEPSPQSEVLSTLEQVFIKDLSVLCSVHLSLDPAMFPPDVTLCIQAKEFNLQFIRLVDFVSHGLRVIRCLLENSCAFY